MPGEFSPFLQGVHPREGHSRAICPFQPTGGHNRLGRRFPRTSSSGRAASRQERAASSRGIFSISGVGKCLALLLGMLSRAESTKQLARHGCQDSATAAAGRCIVPAPALVNEQMRHCPQRGSSFEVEGAGQETEGVKAQLGSSAAARLAEVESGQVRPTRVGGIACDGRRARARIRPTRRG